jgi:hypothetical protein
VQLQQFRPQLGVGVVRVRPRPLFQMHSHLFGHAPQRLRKRQAVDFHHKLEDVASFAAAKTVEDLLHRMHGERGRLLLMERA